MDNIERTDYSLDSKFRVTILAAKRAKQLLNGSKRRVDVKSDNPLTIAIEELNQNRVTYHLTEAEESNEMTADELLANLKKDIPLDDLEEYDDYDEDME